MPSYLLSSLCHLLLLGGSGALAFFLIQDKATVSSYLPMAGSGLALLSLLLTFVRRRQCSLARDTSNHFRASPLVTLFLRLTAVLLLVYAAASVFLALLMFNVVPVPGFFGAPAAVVGESAVVPSSGLMQRMASSSAAAGRIGPATATSRAVRAVRPRTGPAATATPNAGARQQRGAIVSRTVPNVPIVLSSPTAKLNRRQAPKSPTPTTAVGASPTRTPAPKSNGSASTPIRIAGAITPTPTLASAAGGQLSAMNSASSAPKLVVRILAMAQGALGLLAMGAILALPVPLERVGTDALPAFTSLNNVPAAAASKQSSGAKGGPAFQPGLGDAADATMYTGGRSSPMDSKARMGQSPRMASPRMQMDSVASFSNQQGYGAPPPMPPPQQEYYQQHEYYQQQPEPAYYPQQQQEPAYYPNNDQGYYPGPPPPGDFPPQPSYADTLPMTAAAGYRSPPPAQSPQFYDNPAYTSPAQPARAYASPQPAAPRAYASPQSPAPRAYASPTNSSRRPSQDSRGTFASNRLYQDGYGGGAPATPSVGTRSAGVPSIGGPGDYASDTLRSGFSLRNVGAVPGMQERGGVGRVPPPGSRGGGIERTRVEPKRAVARTMYLSDDDE